MTSWSQPLGAEGDHRRRVLRHHLPVALASAVVLGLFMAVLIAQSFGARLWWRRDALEAA